MICDNCGHEYDTHVMGGECNISECECLTFWSDEEEEN